MLNGTPYDISHQFASQTQIAGADIKSFFYTQDTSNHTIKISKDKQHMNGKPVVIHGKNSFQAPKDHPKSQPKGLETYL